MSDHGPNDNARVPPYRDWTFPDGFAISWAGAGRHDGEFCLGSEDGRLLFIAHVGDDVQDLRFGDPDSESVNGTAFIGSTYAVSTRSEVVFLTVPTAGPHGTRIVFPCGAHGVIATAEGSFVAPLGPTGLMTTRPTTSDVQAITLHRIRERPLNYYKAVSVVSHRVPEVIVCAARKDGMVATPLTSVGLTGARVMTLPGLDVVDVCPLGTNLESPSAIALGKDGTLAFFHDVLQDAAPTMIQYGGMEGIAYRVLVVQGTVILLTSQGLYFLHGLAHRFLQGTPLDVPIPTQQRRMEAVDANVADDRWLLIVESDRVIRLDVPQYAIKTAIDASGWSEASIQGKAVSQCWQISQDLPLEAERCELIAA